jgi:hypothetical protein
MAEVPDTPPYPSMNEMMARLSAWTPKIDGEESTPSGLVLPPRAGMATPNIGNIELATMRARDPMWYWQQNNLPYDYATPEGLKSIRKYARLLYITHPIIGSAIDIFASWSLQEMELQSKDDRLVEFYSDLFLDQLDYPDFLATFGREYWTVGEGCSLGSFNEALGIWDDEELINPDEVDIHKSPFFVDPIYKINIPPTLREVLETRNPVHEYEALIRSYPELVHFMQDSEPTMPVSNVLFRMIQFKPDTHFKRGLPLLMRAFRAARQEEMLNAAVDAVADRLYTPLILAKLGASAQQLGGQTPWVPTQGDIAAFNSSLNMALSADFRVLTHHFAVDIQTVFGREVIPRFSEDMDRIAERFLQTFGMSKTMLSGAGRGETYAADALNFELVGQLLSRYQRLIKRHFRERALVVAEAQEHFDYEVRGGKRYLVREERIETDPDTGEQYIVERPKLLVPELKLPVMNLRSESDRRQFVEAMRVSGVPISNRTRAANIPINLDEEAEAVIEEQVELAVQAQRVRRETYLRLMAEGLPVPQDLLDDFAPKAVDRSAPADSAVATPEEQQRLPNPILDPAASTEALVPQNLEEGAPGAPGGDVGAGAPQEGGTVNQLPQNQWITNRPPQSDERRDGMPVAASIVEDDGRIVLAPRMAVEVGYDGEGNEIEVVTAGMLQLGPRHMDRFSGRRILPLDVPIDEIEAPMPAHLVSVAVAEASDG